MFKYYYERHKGMKGCLYLIFLHKNLGISEKFVQNFKKNFTITIGTII